MIFGSFHSNEKTNFSAFGRPLGWKKKKKKSGGKQKKKWDVNNRTETDSADATRYQNGSSDKAGRVFWRTFSVSTVFLRVRY